MAIKALTLTSGWQSALAQFRQLAATARAPLILPGKTIALDMTERAIIAVMFGQFAFRTLRSYEQSADIVTLLLLVSEMLPMLIILLRKPSTTLSDRPSDWFLGLAGTCAVLLITPAPVDPLIWRWVCLMIIVTGMYIQISAKVALGLSFGIVAANRGVRVSGPYRFVRHPMYAGYAITHVGLLLAMPNGINALLYACALLLQIVRIKREERVLMQDQQYRDFSARVRYRLLPGVF
jgi:protein-S-isoprenylcysteine O-methyltransferase Ste14